MKPNENQRKRLLDVRAAGEYLGVSAWTVRELVWKGDLVSVKVGRLVRIDIHDLDCFIEASKHQVGVR
jgi:excisionase family DNA binding protein